MNLMRFATRSIISTSIAIVVATCATAADHKDKPPELSLREQILKILDADELSRLDRIRSLRKLIEQEETSLVKQTVVQWIEQLRSSKFQERQTAQKNLIEAGKLAIESVEQAAAANNGEQTKRCLAILVIIAKKDNPASADALKALERLSKLKSQIGEQAKTHFSELTETDQDRAIAAIKASGARIYPADSGGAARSLSSRGSNFSDNEMIFLKYFPHLTSLRVSGANITDAGLEHLAQLKRLKRVSFIRSSITDIGLESLGSLKSLESLSLGTGNYTNKGLRKLNRSSTLRSLHLLRFSLTAEGVEGLNSVTSLERVTLSLHECTDEDLKPLLKLSKLSNLNLDDSAGITDKGLESLKALKLRSLNLPDSITDKGLEHLREMKSLRSLSLNGTNVTDKGLEHLSEMTSLHSLSLIGTNFTDKSLEHLKGLQGLEYIILIRTGITAKGIESLQKELPNCRVFKF